MVNKSPRILVADDDLGVIAAYRYVLEGDEYAKLSRGRLEQLDEDLFGTSNAGAGLSSLRLQFVDQGEDAVPLAPGVTPGLTCHVCFSLAESLGCDADVVGGDGIHPSVRRRGGGRP